MPIYEYRCGACRRKFEKIVLSGVAPEAVACPKCGAPRAERLVSRFATASKGGESDFGSDPGGDIGDDFGDDYGGDFGGGDQEEFGGEAEEEGFRGGSDEEFDGDSGGDDGEDED